MAVSTLAPREQRYIEKFDLEPCKPCQGWDVYVDKNGNFYVTKPSGISYYMGSYNLHADMNKTT